MNGSDTHRGSALDSISTTKLTALLILWVFATALAPTIGDDQRNHLVTLVSALAPALILGFRLPLPRGTAWIVGVVAYMLSITILLDSMGGLSSVCYTALFASAYLCFGCCLTTGRIERDDIIIFLRFLIIAFGVVSMAQMAASLVGLPVPNLILSKGMWSYNSLAVEPSHLGRVLPISMLAYIILVGNRPTAPRSPWRLIWAERRVVAAFLASALLSGSTLAILAGSFVLLCAFPVPWIIAFSVLFTVGWPYINCLEVTSLQRGLSFLTALPSLDIHELMDADHSGAIRAAPALVYFQKTGFDSPEFWFGGGVKAVRPFLAGELRGLGDSFGAGFFPGFPIAFGMVGTLLAILAFVLRFLHAATWTLVVLWLALFLPSAWNTQLFWYGLMMLRTLHHFEVDVGRSRAGRFRQAGRLPVEIA